MTGIHSSIRFAYSLLLEAYGPQGWWPADTDVEVVVGAVLVQNTAWRNAEKALDQLRASGPIDLAALVELPKERLAALIRPGGTFRVKARRLRALADAIVQWGGLGALSQCSTSDLRERLLAVRGVGPETCDAILCYALRRPVFVVDAYARRLYRRMGLIEGNESYGHLRAMTERALGDDQQVLGEWHALVVEHGKRVCRPKPRCGECVLNGHCPRRGLTAQAS